MIMKKFRYENNPMIAKNTSIIRHSAAISEKSLARISQMIPPRKSGRV